MKKDDQQLDRLLAAVHRHEATAAPDACLDADTLAAWIDGKLAGPALTRAEAHAASCARCQAMLAGMARTAAAERDLHRAPARSWFRRILPWAGPLTAAATAAALYVAVRPPAGDDTRAPVVMQSDRVADLQTPATAADSGRQQTSVPEPAGSPAAASTARAAPAEASREERARANAAASQLPEPTQASAKALADVASVPAPTAPPPAPRPEPDAAGRSGAAATQVAESKPEAPPPAGFARAAAQAPPALQETVLVAPVLIPTADPLARWRIVDERVIERSTDGGKTWAAQHTVSTPAITTGMAPSPDVCWIGGRAGLLLRTVDGGKTWSAVTFPDRGDVSQVRATSADAAIVTTATGRTFETSDGGKTWQER